MGLRSTPAFPTTRAIAAAALGLATGVLDGPPAAHADPVPERVVRGDVTFIRDGNRTIIRASDGSIINHVSFDILPWETVQFIQPGELARVLNRITGPDPSVIQGTLRANGQVYIVNPAGVYFTQGAVVDVGGLYAAAGHISDRDFVNGVDRFTDLSGSVTNEGRIEAGAVHLIGDGVLNLGSIRADRGVITMLAGDTVHLRQHGERITVRIDGATLTGRDRPHAGSTRADMTADPALENSGTVRADRGRIVLGAGDLYGLALRNTGTVEASGGEVTAAATDGLIHNEGVITASRQHGSAGTVVVQAPSILSSGEISADTDRGRAGRVEVTSRNHTFLQPGSRVSAAGGRERAHGGEVLVHSYGGQTVFAREAVVDVSGGDGGGHGGFAEVSGDALIYNGTTRLEATAGYRAGELLIDPHNIVVNRTGGDDEFLNNNIIEFNEGGDRDAYIAASTFSRLIGAITLQARGSIWILEQIDMRHDNDLTLEAHKAISINAPITGVDDLTMTADFDGNRFGDLSINVPLVIGGEGTFAANRIFLNGGSLTSGGRQRYLSPVELCADTTLTAPRVRFTTTVDATNDGQQGLTVNGDVRFEGTVGGTSPVRPSAGRLRSLRVNGSTRLDGGLVRTKGDQRYDGPVTLGRHADLISTGGGTIRFRDTVDGGHDLLVSTAGLTRFDGPVGRTAPLAGVRTDAPGSTRLGADHHAGVLDFNDPVTLGADVTLVGDDTIDLAQVTGRNRDLVVIAPQITFHGAVSGVDLLQTGSAGTTFVDTPSMEARDLDFDNAVVLTSDTRLRGTRSIDFDRTLDGGFDLRLVSDGLRFGDDVGGRTPLAALRADVGGRRTIDRNLIVFEGRRVRATGDIRLNPDGKRSPSRVATIVGRGETLRIESREGRIDVGPNEKVTAIGDLALLARQGRVTTGDLNAAGDLVVDAPRIELRRRAAGRLLALNGRLLGDHGADLVVGGSIVFSSSPSFVGQGATPRFAAGAEVRGLDTLNRGFVFDLSLAGFLRLDLVLDRSVSFPEDDLAEALDPRWPTVEDRVELRAHTLEPLERLAIYVRSLTPDELLATVEGRELYDDVRVAQLPEAPGFPTAVHRLRRESVLSVLGSYASLFGPVGEPAAVEGSPPPEAVRQIRAAFSTAWYEYARDAGPEPAPDGFRSYLESRPEQAEALAYLEGLRSLFREVWTMGATRRELRASLDRVLGPLVPDSLEQETLERAIGIDQIG